MKAFIWTMRVLALIPLATGLLDTTLGLSALALEGPALPSEAVRHASADNAWRFFGVVWAGYAALIWYACTDIARHATLMRIMLVVLFLSGVARASSVLLMGWPMPPFVAAMVLELVGMPLLYWWQQRLLRAQTKSQPW